jgi:hypothetical protein
MSNNSNIILLKNNKSVLLIALIWVYFADQSKTNVNIMVLFIH